MTLQAAITLAPAGDYIALKSFGFSGVGGSSKRGEVQGFSEKSRSRLMAKISQLRKHHLPLFVTLTYPEQYPVEWEEFKADLHRFTVAISKKFSHMEIDAEGKQKRVSDVGLIWKLEFQKRGAAHYHCMLWGLDLETAQNYIPQLWHKIAGQGDNNHLLWHQGKLGHGNKPCVEAVRSWRGVKSYAAKYLGKLDERTSQVTNTVDPDAIIGGIAPITLEDSERLHSMTIEEMNGKEVKEGRSGRFWGVVGNVPFSPLLTFVVDVKTALEFRRAVARSRGMLRLMKHGRFGFWLAAMHPDWITFINHWEEEVSKAPVEGHPEFPPSWFLPSFDISDLEGVAY